MRRRNGTGGLAAGLVTGLLTLAVLALVCLAILRTARDSGEKGREQLETSVRRCVTACYAAEGIYPADIDYLKENYGLQVDESRYVIYYDVFAGNLMPDITVLERTQ